MQLALEGKVALITGASKGIGLAVAQVLAEEGAQVAAASRATTDRLADLDGVVHVAVDLHHPDGPGRR